MSCTQEVQVETAENEYQLSVIHDSNHEITERSGSDEAMSETTNVTIDNDSTSVYSTSQPETKPPTKTILDRIISALSFKSLGFFLAVAGLVTAIYSLRLAKWSVENDHWNTCLADLTAHNITTKECTATLKTGPRKPPGPLGFKLTKRLSYDDGDIASTLWWSYTVVRFVVILSKCITTLIVVMAATFFTAKLIQVTELPTAGGTFASILLVTLQIITGTQLLADSLG